MFAGSWFTLARFGGLAFFVQPRDVVQDIPVILATLVQLFHENVAHPHDPFPGQRRTTGGLNLLEHPLHERCRRARGRRSS